MRRITFQTFSKNFNDKQFQYTFFHCLVVLFKTCHKHVYNVPHCRQWCHFKIPYRVNHKVEHDLSPSFMKDLFTYKVNQKGTRSGDTFDRPNVDSVKMGDRSLCSFGPIVWNTMLPDKLKQCETLSALTWHAWENTLLHIIQ